MSDTFILDFKIDDATCDRFIEEFNKNIDIVRYDELRQYHRLNSERLSQSLKDEFEAQLLDCYDQYNSRWEWCDVSVKAELWHYNVQKYEPGRGYRVWHIEDPGPEPDRPQRKLTWMTYLNDVQQGGETQFMYQSKAYIPRKGVTLIWPAGWTHPHRGQPAPKETKFIATGWFVYSEDNSDYD